MSLLRHIWNCLLDMLHNMGAGRYGSGALIPKCGNNGKLGAIITRKGLSIGKALPPSWANRKGIGWGKRLTGPGGRP